MSRLVLGASHGGSQEADPVLLQNLIDMGFEEAASRAALERTSNRSLEFAIDFIMNNPSSQTVQPSSSAQPSSIAQPAPLLNEPQHSQQPLFAQQTTVSAAAQKPAEKLTSSFDLAAREAHQKKEMEERTRLVREEQKRKKEHEKKVKQQLEEDKMIRKMKPVVGRAKSLSVTELNAHVEVITTFVAENGRPCDVLADLVETLKAHIVSQQTGASETPAAGVHQAAAPSMLADARACQIRLRLSDGSQVIQTLQSNQALKVLHDFVKERQGGDGSFSFIVPGPPGLRSELGEDKLELTLEELGLAPSASLTVQATSKKDLVTVAPEGALFVSAQAGMRMMRGMPAGLPMGLRPMPAVGSDSEDDDDDDPMGASMAYVPVGAEEADLVARAQSESMDLATEEHFKRGQHVPTGGDEVEGGSSRGGGNLHSALDEATRTAIDAVDLEKVRIPKELLDPITEQLMKDPVKLPCSGSIMDRSTIMRHLRTNRTDPYTNTALSAAHLSPATELIPKYKAWLLHCQAPK